MPGVGDILSGAMFIAKKIEENKELAEEITRLQKLEGFVSGMQKRIKSELKSCEESMASELDRVLEDDTKRLLEYLKQCQGDSERDSWWDKSKRTLEAGKLVHHLRTYQSNMQQNFLNFLVLKGLSSGHSPTRSASQSSRSSRRVIEEPDSEPIPDEWRRANNIKSIALRAKSNGKYLSAKTGWWQKDEGGENKRGRGEVKADRGEKQGWETFTMEKVTSVADGQNVYDVVSLRSFHGKYVSAKGKPPEGIRNFREGEVLADVDERSGWEMFKVQEHFEDSKRIVSFKSFVDGKYLSVKDGLLKADSDQVKESEKFILEQDDALLPVPQSGSRATSSPVQGDENDIAAELRRINMSLDTLKNLEDRYLDREEKPALQMLEGRWQYGQGDQRYCYEIKRVGGHIEIGHIGPDGMLFTNETDEWKGELKPIKGHRSFEARLSVGVRRVGTIKLALHPLYDDQEQLLLSRVQPEGENNWSRAITAKRVRDYTARGRSQVGCDECDGRGRKGFLGGGLFGGATGFGIYTSACERCQGAGGNQEQR